MQLRARYAGFVISCVTVILFPACDTPERTAAVPVEPGPAEMSANGGGNQDRWEVEAEVRALAAQHGITPLPDAPHVRNALVKLGRDLAFDPILSGNHDVSCMTCHVPKFATVDRKSLSIGVGGAGLGPMRSHPEGMFIPRNAPAAFNLASLKRLFWDGRVEVDDAGAFHTPAGAQITPAMANTFEFGAASALALFPVTSRTEMRGFSGNELAAIPDADMTGIWGALMQRLGANSQYRRMFENAYPGTPFGEMTFAHASNAIGAFLVSQFTFTNSPWDRFLAGKSNALSDEQLAGAKTFMSIRCVQCHNGPTLSDQEFHNVALAQIGPGVGNGTGGHDDFGRWNVTGNDADRYRFRTTPLRNVELTAPYGHDGSIVDLRAFVEHYSESDLKLTTFDPFSLDVLLQGTVLQNAAEINARRDPIIIGVVLPDETVDQLMAFMSALTDPAARRLDNVVPHHVPSGLPVERP
ncbi:MAG TPA: cytochrome c peroxidase [Gemmatimonadaceae bacterium]|nr:cytochrome c peroxidase [Gemmatimonadaceae bacterium]